nr:Chain A, GINS [Methanocaldococcus jannaschii DSM 2661]7YIL_B Chain B, GINS [Methanocaldococcus jannaschii DSM 2661]
FVITMYESLKNYFFEEIKNDKLLKLPDDFYDDIREYIKNIKDDIELERVKYYFKELRKLRIYKALYLDNERENLLPEELNIIHAIENIVVELKIE